MLDVGKIREDFPILRRKVHGKALAYLDNAATTQKPRQVLDAISSFYRHSNANPHRGVHLLAMEATEQYEQARANIASFIGAKPEEVIFTRNATDSLNLVANLICSRAGKGSRILLTKMEHHSNLVSWQLAAKRSGCKIDYLGLGQGWRLLEGEAEEMLQKRPAAFSFTHVSNVLGTKNDAAKLCAMAREAGAWSCVDAAQSVPHMEIDVRRIGCDFLAFSGHKMLGPTGIGVLYMRLGLQEELEPFFGGGEMIREVSLEGATWSRPPHKFEPGTQDFAGAIGLSAAADYLRRAGLEEVGRHGQELASYCRKRLEEIPCVSLYGQASRAGIVAFNIKGVHPHDAAHFADRDGIAIRSGHHCAQPLMKALGVSATCRASFYLYNTKEEADRLAESMERAAKALG